METSENTYKIELDRESLKQYQTVIWVIIFSVIAVPLPMFFMLLRLITAVVICTAGPIEFRRYSFIEVFFWLGFTGICTVIFAAGIFFVFYKFFGEWLISRQAEEKNYFVKGDTLCVNEGVFFLSRKTIPLNRITDVVLIQGPIMRFFGFWRLQIQTASVGTPTPEAVLWAINDPQAVRDEIFKRRKEAVSPT